MAKPRVFISSTFFDLRTLRDDLDRFVKGQGFESVRHERGQIPYGAEEKPEHYAYREIDICDMLICIIGGRYGTASSFGNHSITQRELKTALEKGKQVYIFVEDTVFHEHRYYLINKSVAGVKFPAVDSTKVHEFLEEIQGVSKGNPIFTFSIGADITEILQEQWAGLFQRLLQENATRQQTALIDELQRSLSTVGQLVQFLTEQNNNNKTAIEEILFENHPIFSELREILVNPYRIYFRDFGELSVWLKSARGFEPIATTGFDEYPDHFEWAKTIKVKDKQRTSTLLVHKSLFSPDGRLRSIQQADWQDDFINLTTVELKQKTGFDEIDDDIPF